MWVRQEMRAAVMAWAMRCWYAESLTGVGRDPEIMRGAISRATAGQVRLLRGRVEERPRRVGI